jgi:hypothetical protein
MRHVFPAGILLVTLILAPVLASAEETATENTPEQATASAPASDRNGFSLGLILGDPTGITLRAGLGESNAIQAHLGFSPFPGDAIAIMVDWTYDAWVFLRDNPTASLPFYFGFGGKAEWFSGHYYAYHDHRDYSDQSHFGFGARGLVGLRASFVNAPFDLFIELAPVGFLVVVPDTGIFYDIDFAIGARYRF